MDDRQLKEDTVRWVAKAFDVPSSLLVPQYEPCPPRGLMDKMRTHDANVELNYLRYRDGGICIGYDWRFLDWGLGFSVFADPNYMPGLWLHLGPLDIGIYKNTER